MWKQMFWLKAEAYIYATQVDKLMLSISAVQNFTLRTLTSHQTRGLHNVLMNYRVVVCLGTLAPLRCYCPYVSCL